MREWEREGGEKGEEGLEKRGDQSHTHMHMLFKQVVPIVQQLLGNK